jgi:hypothetical protein
MLYVDWRPCQRMVYRLVEFSEGVEWISRPFSREATQMRGAAWAVETVAVQLAIEGALSDDQPDRGALAELVDELLAVCQRHLAIADREMSNLARADASARRSDTRWEGMV